MLFGKTLPHGTCLGFCVGWVVFICLVSLAFFPFFLLLERISNIPSFQVYFLTSKELGNKSPQRYIENRLRASCPPQPALAKSMAMLDEFLETAVVWLWEQHR